MRVNADEHNIPSVTEHQKIVMVAEGKPVAAFEKMISNKGTFRHLDDQTPDLTKAEMRVYPDRAKLIRVGDSGVDYDPPAKHLGVLIEDNGPIAVPRLMVHYIEAMTEEAKALTVR